MCSLVTVKKPKLKLSNMTKIVKAGNRNREDVNARASIPRWKMRVLYD
jgi:hypothetical protein